MENIRNFVIISHVDHGKSTLADRFLELTKTVDPKKMRPQYLDLMDLERERGITIKMQPCRMRYGNYILNLIDTPGHVDFSYEVSRSLAAVEGAVLLVDATKGIQAQTIGNLELARQQNLVVIPVINKIDLLQARVEETSAEIAGLLQVDPLEIIKISAKQGTNIERVLEEIIKKIPPPEKRSTSQLKALVFDSKYDLYKGVVVFVRVFDGEVKKEDEIFLIQNKVQSETKEVGFFNPELEPVEKLEAGEIGYIATGIKEPEQVRVGETISNSWINPLPGYKEPQPKVFLSIYPEKSNDFETLKTALEKLKLNDAAFVFKPELKEGLGRGFQCGFLGLLHAEIVAERLKREFGLSLILSSPSVVYEALVSDRDFREKEILVYTPQNWPPEEKIKEVRERWVELKVLTPQNYLGKVLELLESFESKPVSTNYLGSEKMELIYEVPLRVIVVKNFYDKLKSISQGFASMDYRILDWRKADLAKLDVLILGKKEEAFSRIVPKKEAYQEGKKLIERIKEVFPPQLFSVPVQAQVGGKIIARENIKAKGRDVIAPLYGGDYSRKRKLLERQKKGKKKLKERGRMRIPPETYLKVLS